MTDEPENLMLRNLRRLDGKMDGLSETLTEHGHRLTRIETGFASRRREQANDADALALSTGVFARCLERYQAGA